MWMRPRLFPSQPPHGVEPCHMVQRHRFENIMTTRASNRITRESGKKKAHKLLTHKLFEKAVNPGTTSRLTRNKENAYCPGFGGEHINLCVRLTGRTSRGQPDPDQSKNSMFMCLLLFLERSQSTRKWEQTYSIASMAQSNIVGPILCVKSSCLCSRNHAFIPIQPRQPMERMGWP